MFVGLVCIWFVFGVCVLGVLIRSDLLRLVGVFAVEVGDGGLSSTSLLFSSGTVPACIIWGGSPWDSSTITDSIELCSMVPGSLDDVASSPDDDWLELLVVSEPESLPDDDPGSDDEGSEGAEDDEDDE